MTTIRPFASALAAALLFTLLAPASGAPAGWRVTTRGFGPVRAGMTIREASAAFGVALVSAGEPQEDCRYVSPKRGFDGLSFMVIGDTIARVDVESKAYATPSGARVGDTEQRIKSLYPGQIEVEPHAYVDGHYLTFVPKDAADKGFRIVFETDGKRVTHIRAGRLPEVGYIEGCS